MEIIGDKEFISNTKKALKLIKKKSPTSYEFLSFYLENIIQNDFSYLYSYDVISYYVSEKISSNIKLYASYLLREAYHSYLIQCSIISNKENVFNYYNGKRNYKLCNKFHIDVMKELGVSSCIIDSLKLEFENGLNDDHMIKIVGDKGFICKVKEALLLLKERDYLSYKTVIQNISKVIYFPSHESTFFDRFQEVPTCCMNSVEHDESVENMCGALLHEACHSKLYKDALYDNVNPDEACSGYSAEMYCLTREIECMKNVGASDELIQKYISFYDKRWWERDNTKRMSKH